MVRAFLAEDGVVGPNSQDALDDRALGRKVDLGDEVAGRGFLADLEPALEAVAVDGPGALGELDREPPQLVEVSVGNAGSPWERP